MGDSPDVVCPVCDEPFRERPTRCFRCETNLHEWWPLEDLLRGDETAPVVPIESPTEASRETPWTLLIVVAICLAFAGFFAGRLAPRSTELVPGPLSQAPATPTPSVHSPEPLHTPTPEPPPVHVLRYSVQKGDSVWRVAATLTGSGQNWQLLWPELKDKPLQIGSVLEVRLDRLETLRRNTERR